MRSRIGTLLLKTSAATTLCLAVAGCVSGTDGFSDGTEKTKAEGDLIGSVLTVIGAKASKGEPISYTERAPLVMPSDRKRLPTPDERAVADLAANWPKDTRDQEMAELREFFKTEDGKPLTAAQMAAAHELTKNLPKQQRNRIRELQDERIMDGKPLTPRELQQMSRDFKAAKAKIADDKTALCELTSDNEVDLATCKLERRYLTQPPQAYNIPAAGYTVSVSPEDDEEEFKKKRNTAAVDDGARIDLETGIPR
ncbi:hypothetical protein [Flexibacterium corallicola]|uniref:hypothetical protein n=1 Tax=Flexibacterium corallicola TaxID=3037259 RepID=UPI00286FA04A|nr:hypothetical protein [Pseudovibrio sp. M1P-2-3]